jgi:heptosyltransferase-1
MKILIIKMSSLGDVIHCLPAVTDLHREQSNIIMDWVVEEGFEDIPALHPGVRRVIPIAIRRWRKSWLASRKEVMNFVKKLRQESYDLVIDAQGLLKSALVGGIAKGTLVGFDRNSARESIASLAYGHSYQVHKNQHAVHRLRELFARVLDYEIAEDYDYGLPQEPVEPGMDIFFFHGTTWASKHWPEEHWLSLGHLCQNAGYRVVLPYLDHVEQRRAENIVAAVEGAKLLPPGSLSQLGVELAHAAGAVSVDTGLGHFATAFNLPLVGIYGPTSHRLTGIVGPRQVSLSDSTLTCAPCLNRTCKYARDSGNIYPPCFKFVTPELVFKTLVQRMKARK